MQFIYIDESGIGGEPVAVMVGVIADSHRMRKTKDDWNSLLSNLSTIIGENICEIHTRDFYSGNSPWRDLKGNQRSLIIDEIFLWLQQRKHSVVYTAVDVKQFNDQFRKEPYCGEIKTLWRFMALHLSLSLQKCYQGGKQGKNRKINHTGHSVMIFDNENCEQKHFTDLLINSPDWVDDYYDKAETQQKFSQIIDVPHFVDSKDVGLIQLSDFLCFFLRKYIELEMGYTASSYVGEKEKITRWVNILFSQSIPKSCIYPARRRSNSANLFYRYAPRIIL